MAAADHATQPAGSIADSHTQIGTGYSWYVLGLCFVVYIFNFVDRQILSILAEDIKSDLGLTDGDLGFLYGTAFAIFYGLFGIPLGKLADMWVRTRLMAMGLALWSFMTAVSGTATSFAQLATARIGVGIGEASGSPCAYSLLADYFPRHLRASVLAAYSSAIYVGGGLSLFLGGWIVQAWTDAYPVAGTAPWALKGWQVAFLAVGLPGLLLSILVAFMREPVRGLADGLITPPTTGIWRAFLAELASVIPPFTVLHIQRLGGNAALRGNILIALVCGGLALIAARTTQDTVQWTALGIGAYAVASWAQSLKLRDPPAFELIWRTPAFLYAVTAFGLISFSGYSIGYWAAPYVERTFGVAKSDVGFYIGGGAIVGGFLGILSGGLLADRLKSRGPAGRVWVALASAILPAPLVAVAYTTQSPIVIYLLHPIYTLLGTMWVGIGGATTQDLVLPRMRGIASATYFVGTTIIGLALGPYFTGYVSHATGSLSIGILALFVVLPVVIYLLWQLKRTLPAAEATRVARAQAKGEMVQAN